MQTVYFKFIIILLSFTLMSCVSNDIKVRHDRGGYITEIELPLGSHDVKNLIKKAFSFNNLVTEIGELPYPKEIELDGDIFPQYMSINVEDENSAPYIYTLNYLRDVKFISEIYLVNNKSAIYTASYSINIESSQKSKSVVYIKAIDSEIIIGTSCCGHFGLRTESMKVKSTTQEECKILKFITHYFNRNTINVPIDLPLCEKYDRQVTESDYSSLKIKGVTH